MATSLEPPDQAREGIVRHDPGTVSTVRLRRGPEEHGRLRPNGYSGLRRVWAHVGIPAKGEKEIRHLGRVDQRREAVREAAGRYLVELTTRTLAIRNYRLS
jgi:hypothetical protein